MGAGRLQEADNEVGNTLVTLAEGTAVPTGTCRAISEGCVVIFRGVAFEECRVGMEFFAAAMELTFAAENHFRSCVERANGAAQLDVESSILLEIANIVAV